MDLGLGNRTEDWRFGIKIGVWGLGLGARIGFGLTLVYRLKIIFELEGYLIICWNADLVRKCSQHNLTLFLNYSNLN